MTRIRSEKFKPSWSKALIKSNHLADESSILQLGIPDELDFISIESEGPYPSYMRTWPNDTHPEINYKITQASVALSMHQNIIERKTYSMLEWLGDIGGLYDAFRLIGSLVVAPMSAFMLRSELLSQVFRFITSKRLAQSKSLSSKSEKADNPRDFSLDQS